MKILQINMVPNGSTGKIMFSIHKELLNQGFDSYVIWGRGNKIPDNYREIKVNSSLDILFHKIYSRIFGKQGFASWSATKKIVKLIDKINPDVVHLHNLHGSFINIEILFNYLKKKKIRIIWTLHDCWAFTGKCAYFELANCYKWKEECENCPILKDYPEAYIDQSNWCYKKKKELFSGLNLTIITPSKWLANYVKESFLKDYPVKVINNGIDIDIFKPTKSNIRKKYNIEDKKIILGVASPWSKRKGLNDFIELSKVLDDSYRIFLVGLNQKQIDSLPDNIIGITRTENQQELAGIYSTADILFNPTYEDNYPTVNLEAIACGTPVLTYDTGGSPEFVRFIDNKKNIKYVVEKEKVKDNINILKNYIDEIIENKYSFKLKDRNILNESTMVNEYIKEYSKGE